MDASTPLVNYTLPCQAPTSLGSTEPVLANGVIAKVVVKKNRNRIAIRFFILLS